MARGRHGYDEDGMKMGRLPRRRPMGLDPNRRGGGYRGQRMSGRDGGALYGRYSGSRR